MMDPFYWPNQRSAVKRYVKGCVRCARGKPFTAPPGPLHPLEIPSTPFSTIAIDLVTGLPKAEAYFDGAVQTVDTVLTVADVLTHFVYFFAVPKTITGEQVAKTLMREVFTPQATVPTRIVSDRDVRWSGHLVRQIMELLGTRLALSTVRSPTTNGLCEAKNKHLVTYLKTVGARASNWPALLHTCALAYNAAYCVSIDMSPAEARYGIAPAFPFAIRTTGASSLPAALRDLKETQELALACAKDALVAAGDASIGLRGQRFARPFKVGDEVMVDSTVLLPPSKHVVNRKVSARFLGPYKVVRKIGPEAYEIDLPPESRSHRTLSIRYLKPFVSTDHEFPYRPKVGVDSQELLMDFVVDKILKHRKHKKNGLEFHVLWAGYPRSQATWEPIDHFMEDGHVTNEILSQYMHDRDMIIP